ncbi:MAG TPA: hypothetical protein VHV09_17385 [Trebonia sp.]|nr:hypothetical protein [Trebonia sp.]
MTAAVLAGTSVTLLYTVVDEWVEADGERALAEFILDGVRALRAALDRLPATAEGPAAPGPAGAMTAPPLL